MVSKASSTHVEPKTHGRKANQAFKKKSKQTRRRMAREPGWMMMREDNHDFLLVLTSHP